MDDKELRARIKEAIIRQSSAVGLGLACPHCGGGLSGAGIWDWADPNKNGLNASIADTGRKIKNEFTNPNSLLAQGVKKVGNEFTNKDSVLRGKILPEAAKIANVVTPFLAGIPGVGEAAEALNAGLQGAQKANQGAKSVGLGLELQRRGEELQRRKGGWSDEAKARARARAAAPGSHGSKVKAYMKKHKGCSLAEASKAVSK